jgi:hypothetical protein
MDLRRLTDATTGGPGHLEGYFVYCIEPLSMIVCDGWADQAAARQAGDRRAGHVPGGQRLLGRPERAKGVWACDRREHTRAF